jgi:hypothetical protein
LHALLLASANSFAKVSEKKPINRTIDSSQYWREGKEKGEGEGKGRRRGECGREEEKGKWRMGVD